METASSKKLAISPPSCTLLPSTSSAGESYDYVGEKAGYRLISCERLDQAPSSHKCSVCLSPCTLEEDLATRRGLVSKLVIRCTNAACGKEVVLSDPYSQEAKSLNARSVLGMRAIGRGRASLESFCGLMDMLPPVSGPSYCDHNQHLARVSLECCFENMLAASAHLHQLHSADPRALIDVAVTCDGTWSKRGFTATHGVIVVISWESGQVLDFQIMTK